MDFAEKLTRLMVNPRITAGSLGVMCGGKRSTVENWKRKKGATEPTFEQLLVIQRFYCVDLEWLIDEARTEWPPPRPMANNRAAILAIVGEAISSAAEKAHEGADIPEHEFEDAL